MEWRIHCAALGARATAQTPREPPAEAAVRSLHAMLKVSRALINSAAMYLRQQRSDAHRRTEPDL